MTNNFLSLWDFACRVYQLPDVEESCLILQEQYSIDIPLLLYCYWAAMHYGQLSKNDLHQAKLTTSQWSGRVIKPLRSIRQEMKVVIGFNISTDTDSWENIRQQIKALELEAEKSLLLNLQEFLSEQNASQGCLDAVWQNLTFCFPGKINSDVQDILQIIFSRVDAWRKQSQ